MTSGDQAWTLNAIKKRVPGSTYVLPAATTTLLGGVTVGTNIQVQSGRISVAWPDFVAHSELLPVIVTQPTGANVVAPTPFTLTVGAVGSSMPNAGSYALQYTWYQNGVAIQDGPSPSYTNAAPDLTAIGSYFCRVTNWFGHVDSAVVAVIVRQVIGLTDLNGNQLTDLNGNPLNAL